MLIFVHNLGDVTAMRRQREHVWVIASQLVLDSKESWLSRYLSCIGGLRARTQKISYRISSLRCSIYVATACSGISSGEYENLVAIPVRILPDLALS